MKARIVHELGEDNREVFEEIASGVFDAVKGQNSNAVVAALGYILTLVIVDIAESHLNALEHIKSVSEKLVDSIDDVDWVKKKNWEP
jgi:hypothetical protein